MENGQKNRLKTDNFLFFTPIFMKIDSKQVYRSTIKMSEADF